ncbi:MAG: zinc finger domain-containing protein [Candidatus Geothermarchaeales archaeon]
MSEELIYRIPKCTSCGKLISPEEKSSKFPCPQCGEAVIWRCEKCRIFIRDYTCPNCGFVGP